MVGGERGGVAGEEGRVRVGGGGGGAVAACGALDPDEVGAGVGD